MSSATGRPDWGFDTDSVCVRFGWVALAAFALARLRLVRVQLHPRLARWGFRVTRADGDDGARPARCTHHDAEDVPVEEGSPTSCLA